MTKLIIRLPMHGRYMPSPAAIVREPKSGDQYTLPQVAEHFNLDEACEQARLRIAEYVERSAAQHLLHIRSQL